MGDEHRVIIPLRTPFVDERGEILNLADVGLYRLRSLS